MRVKPLADHPRRYLFLLEIIVLFISQVSQRYHWGSPEKDIESRLFVCRDELEIYTTFLELLAFH